MVLSNKKLKQKMRAAKAQILIETQNGVASENPKTVESLKILQDLEAQKHKLSKRQKHRQKAKLDNLDPNDQRQVDSNVDERLVAEVNSAQVNLKKAKGKRGLPSASESGNVEEPEVPNKRPKKKGETMNKTENKQIEETDKGMSAIDSEQLILNSLVGDDRKEQEPSTKVYVGGIPYYSTEDDIRSYFSSCGSITHVDCLRFPDSGKFRGIAIITFKTEAAARRALAFDGSDMGGLFLNVQPYKSTKRNKDSNFSPAAVQGYYRIYVGNLAWNITEDDLRKTFSDCKITSIRLGQDKETGDFKGYAHIDFANDLSFSMALKLDQTSVCGRPIKISCAVPKKGAATKPKDNQADGNIGFHAQQHQTNNRDAGDVLQQKDNQVNGNKVDDVRKDHPNDQDQVSTVTKDEETSKEASTVSSSKIRRRTCYECGQKGHLSSSCPNKQAASVAAT